jgi:predicted extracellular nuclease
MNRKVLFSFLFLLFVWSSYADVLSILEWNVGNFFDTIDNPNTKDTILTDEEYARKMQLIAGMVKNANADVVALCEIENETILGQLADQCGYEYRYLIEGNDERGINVAMMSRLEAVYSSNRTMKVPYKGNPHYRFSRDCPVAKITIDDKNVYILINHLKSMIGDPIKTEQKRIAQVGGILDIIDRIYQTDNTPYIILTGDFNSHRMTEPLNILQKAGLTILNYAYKESETYTHIYHGDKRDLDYFMINDIVSSNIRSFSIRTYHKMDRHASDHYPILLKLDIK